MTEHTRSPLEGAPHNPEHTPVVGDVLRVTHPERGEELTFTGTSSEGLHLRWTAADANGQPLGPAEMRTYSGDAGMALWLQLRMFRADTQTPSDSPSSWQIPLLEYQVRWLPQHRAGATAAYFNEHGQVVETTLLPLLDTHDRRRVSARTIDLATGQSSELTEGAIADAELLHLLIVKSTELNAGRKPGQTPLAVDHKTYLGMVDELEGVRAQRAALAEANEAEPSVQEMLVQHKDGSIEKWVVTTNLDRTVTIARISRPLDSDAAAAVLIALGEYGKGGGYPVIAPNIF